MQNPNMDSKFIFSKQKIKANTNQFFFERSENKNRIEKSKFENEKMENLLKMLVDNGF